MPEGVSGWREYRKKICLLGDYAVGKTSLVSRYVNDCFEDMYIVTIGVKITSKVMLFRDAGLRCTLSIWDIGGHLEPYDVPKNYFNGAQGAILVCDITRRKSLEKLKEWSLVLFNNTKGDVPIVLLVNKNDLQPGFSEEDVKKTATDMSATYYYSSAKTGDNVEKAFADVTKRMLVEKKITL